jgi:hypothetical protein
MPTLTIFGEMVSPYNKPTPDAQALVKQLPKDKHAAPQQSIDSPEIASRGPTGVECQCNKR